MRLISIQIATLVLMVITLTISTIFGLQHEKQIKYYKHKADSLKNRIDQLSTDTITSNEWKCYGDTIQYIGKDSILMVYPVEYYRLVVTANQRTKNQIWSIESKFYNDTITKTID